ncbi:hypothetical protein SELMODRAFT_406684 [Selaginella moellendorffii]|uniref:Uncharacterized protein n=1 Tax=Selaginella moellendorffii TaxID=88036 RepID=D8R147_SELML|nr:hypothetical protein SELMODRAFT_406684 [Selaginella moellendorffii]
MSSSSFLLALLCISIGSLASAASAGEEDSVSIFQVTDGKLRGYPQWVSFKITNLGRDTLEVKNSFLSYGKWYKYPNKNNDGSAPGGITIAAGATSPNPPFAACGRQGSPSGTTGGFDIYTKGFKVATIHFDCPYTGSNKLSVSDECKNCVVQLPSFSTSGALGDLVLKVVVLV